MKPKRTRIRTLLDLFVAVEPDTVACTGKWWYLRTPTSHGNIPKSIARDLIYAEARRRLRKKCLTLFFSHDGSVGLFTPLGMKDEVGFPTEHAAICRGMELIRERTKA